MMTNKVLTFAFFLISQLISFQTFSQKTDSLKCAGLKLWYTKPAELWVEALPLGNGRLGAMVFGNPYRERIQLNENTVWAGSP